MNYLQTRTVCWKPLVTLQTPFSRAVGSPAIQWVYIYVKGQKLVTPI